MSSLYEEKEFKSKLKLWAEKAVEYCHKVATHPDKDKKIDKAFYAFQSKPIKNPKVLILGINPAGDNSYAAQYDNKDDFWGIRKERKMTPEVFMKQNPAWDNPVNWKIWHNLKKVFHTNNLRAILDQKDFMYMNILYFNSNTIDDFFKINSSSKKVFKDCLDMTTDLIKNIIQPEHIVCLSIPDCFEKLNSGNPDLLLTGKIRLLVKGKFSEISAYGIPHTSGVRGVTDENWRNIGLLLHREIFEEDLNIILKNYINKIQQHLVQIANKHNLELSFDKKKLSKQFGFFKFSIEDIDWLSIYFEFQSPYYGDLKYGFNVVKNKRDVLSDEEKEVLGYKENFKFYENHGWINLQKCERYSNWINLDDNFNIDEFNDYFESLILPMVEKLKNLN